MHLGVFVSLRGRSVNCGTTTRLRAFPPDDIPAHDGHGRQAQGDTMKRELLKRDELKDVILDAGIPSHFVDTHELDFKDLMRVRINNILLVSSRYDFYTLVDDGQLTEAIISEYLDLNLHYAPLITRVYSGEAALDALRRQPFDLVITMQRLGDMRLRTFCVEARKIAPDLTLVLLAYQSREFQMLLERDNLSLFDRTFIWSGDRKLFLALIKVFEDLENAPIDCLDFGVRAMILVEDSPMFYSSYMPLIYTEMIQQGQNLIEEGKNFADKLLRQRARPKILHATTYEEAWDFFKKYRGVLLGIVTDLKFRIGDELKENAGLTFIERVRAEMKDLPILVQSAQVELQESVEAQNCTFVDKYSRTLLQEVREFMKQNFGFGEFIFRLPDGTEVERARNIRELRRKLREVPDSCLLYHASNNHFSNWLMARTRFQLAEMLKPIKITQFADPEELRAYMIDQIDQLVIHDNRGIISDFSRDEYDPHAKFQRIGGGSLGGKARGLAFIDTIFKTYLKPEYFPRVRIAIPKTYVICTDVFTEFMEMNGLLPIAVQNISDEEIVDHFLHAKFPREIEEDLRLIISANHYPLAVRSSSLLEDTLYQPFAGIYSTLMLPNSNRNPEVRYQRLVQAIKFVFASTYFRGAKNYIEATGHRMEEEKMAVVIQQITGKRYDHFFYPHFSGVARSYNYYPFGDAKQDDGIVNLAVGLGKTIVDGGLSVTYCPEYPAVLPQFMSQKDYFNNSQRRFYALDLGGDIVMRHPVEDQNLVSVDIKVAERHNSLRFLASTYDFQNDALYEGTFRTGHRVINFAPLLQSDIVPVNKVVRLLLRLCETAMNCPVEIEFAGTLDDESGLPADFSFLQVRPMVKEEGFFETEARAVDAADLLLQSDKALGNGVSRLSDIVFVKPDVFDHAKTRDMAVEIDAMNRALTDEGRQYLLIGPGRWGSSDPWLGIPVKFTNISSARAIVENSLPNMIPDPSQGSHFFQNLTSFRIAYFTLRHYKESDVIDWDWLNGLETVAESTFVKHVRAPRDLEVRVNGQTGKGVIVKYADVPGE
ncbi:MAG: histidine kinase [Ignavibacteriae bacterium]|nr:histidine kinase [Ignavibacteriota bacterium]